MTGKFTGSKHFSEHLEFKLYEDILLPWRERDPKEWMAFRFERALINGGPFTRSVILEGLQVIYNMSGVRAKEVYLEFMRTYSWQF